MPEIPDLTVYAEAIGRRFGGRRLQRLRALHVFVLRTSDPPRAAPGFEEESLRSAVE